MSINESERPELQEAVERALTAYASEHPLLGRYASGERTEALLFSLGREVREAAPTRGRAEGVRQTVRAVERFFYLAWWSTRLGSTGRQEVASEASKSADLALQWSEVG